MPFAPRPHPGQTHPAAAWNRAPRFFRNAAISLPTFLLDLGLLFVMVRLLHVDYLIASVLAFLVANGLNYFAARRLVFAGTTRGVKSGLVYFLAIAALSAFALASMMWLFVSILHLELILSRLVAATSVGVCGYLLNLVFNFRIRSHAGRAAT